MKAYAKYLEWFGVATAIIYSLLVASNTGSEFLGFTLLLISAIAIGLWAWSGRHRGILLLQFFYAAAGLIGMFRWFRFPQHICRVAGAREGFMSLSYVYLIAAIFLEVTGTMLLPVSANFTRLWPTLTLAVCYMAAFWLLTFAIRTIPISIVYATWSGLGVFTIAILGALIFKQTLGWPAILGLFLIVIGVILVNLYSAPHP